MEFKTKQRSKIKLSIYGEEMEIDMPRVEQISAYQIALENASDTKKTSSEIMIDYLESLGIPKAVVLKMERDDFLDLIQFIGEVKKK